MVFQRKKKLFEEDPKTLSIELLTTLQRALIAKLTIVNRELGERGTSLVELSAELEGVEDVRQMFRDSGKRIDLLNDVLERYLSSEIARDKTD